MSDQQTYVFNQYYIDLLKKVKGYAKEQKETSKSARDILRAIKKHYSSMDKLSNEYVEFLQQNGFWNEYNALEDKDSFTDEFLTLSIYKEITLQQIADVLGNTFLLRHFICLMDIFMVKDLPVEKVLDVIKVLNNAESFEEKIKEISSEEIVTKLRLLTKNHKSHTQSALQDELKEIESTSLGKLAKEIMQDINIEDLQKTLGDPNGGDLLSSLQNPDSGFGKVFSTVSQKMLSKITSGELKQDQLLDDAMQLASKIPNLIPGGMSSQLGNIGSMLKQFQNMGMGGQEGGFNPIDLMKNMGLNLNGPQRNAANSRMTHAMKKQKAADRLKKKLQKHRENNIQREVEEDQ